MGRHFVAKVLAISWKDVLVRFSSRSEILFFLVLPIVFTVVVAQFAGGGADDNRTPLLVVDQDGSNQAQDLVALLAGAGAVRPMVLPAEDAQARFDHQDAPAMLVIPAGFGSSLLEGKPVRIHLSIHRDDANYPAAEQAVQAATRRLGAEAAIAAFSLQQAEQGSDSLDQVAGQAYLASSLDQAAALFEQAPQRMEMTYAAQSGFDATYDGTAQASAGQLVIWVFIPLLGTSVLFAYERIIGTLRRLLTTPTRRSTFLLGTITGQLTMGLVQMALLIGFGVLVMKVNWGQSPLALALVLVSFGLASVAMGTMLGTFVRTTSQANGLSIMLGMTMGLLGGCMWPLELFPPAIRTAVHVLPTTWAMQGLTDITMRGLGLRAVLPEATVLLGFALAFFVIGVRRFRFE